MSAMSILIVDDHKLTCECLKMGLEKESDMTILGQAYDGKSAIEMAKQLKPNMILMDICLPNINGIQATAAIKQFLPDTKVIMTTSMMDKKVVQAAFAANADGYCTKETPLASLIQMMRTVLDGAICIDPKVALYAIREIAGVTDINAIGESDLKPPLPSPIKDLPSRHPEVTEKRQTAKSLPISIDPVSNKNNISFEQPQPFAVNPSITPMKEKSFESNRDWQTRVVLDTESVQPIPGKIEDHLTQRELEILKLIADNNTNEQIAQKTGLSSAWLASHIKNILLKLSVSNEVQAIRRALHEGLIEDAPLLHQMD